MPHKLEDVSIDQLMIEHYLFDLGQSVEKTSEILDMDEEKVRRIHQESSRFHTAVRKDHR
nr:MAG: hypothetical protein [Bacteriophage sp.]